VFVLSIVEQTGTVVGSAVFVQEKKIEEEKGPEERKRNGKIVRLAILSCPMYEIDLLI